MRILLLGATGRTGKSIIEEAIKRGYAISAIARNPQKLKDYKIEIIEGTPYDYETVEKAIDGCDAVINTLNISRKTDNPWSPLVAPKDLISKSATNVLKAMQKNGVKRFVVLGAIGAGRSWKTSPAILKCIVSFSNLKYAFQDHGLQEQLLESSSIDYTICRAPMLTEKINENGVGVTSENATPKSPNLSRKSVAKFFIDIIETGKYIKETIHISDNKK
jgi:putative NADH-flavin reductase